MLILTQSQNHHQSKLNTLELRFFDNRFYGESGVHAVLPRLHFSNNLSSSVLNLPIREQHKPCTLIWREGEGPRELVLYVAASGRGFYWRVSEGRVLLHSSIGMIESRTALSEAALERLAAGIGRNWINQNFPGAQVRLRSALERLTLFGARSLQPRKKSHRDGRRRAA